jgi:tRNA A37 threonylcarbamoyladenosine synthetase subunit TsaC/SUA5/YrdC
MPIYDTAGDARRAFDVLKKGGIAIMPNDIGYSLIGGSAASLKRIFDTKQRAPTKLNAMVGNEDIRREVHICSARAHDVVAAITKDYGLPLGCIAPANFDHPLLRNLDRNVISASSKDGTIVMLLNAGRFHAAITALSHAEGHPLFGSSANKTLSGTKFCVEDIEPEIKAIADIVIDHGLQKYHPYKSSSTLLNVETMEVVRFGSCYRDIAYILKRHFKVELPRPPIAS